ncbi:MAG: FHA domain-containing protein [Bacteriovoracia bacterium]
MIEFKIISTVDRSQIGNYQHLGAELTIGSADGEMLIDDPQIAALQLRVRVAGGQPTLENLEPGVEARLNGRPFEGTVPLKEKDNVSVGKTSIQILRLDLSTIAAPEPIDHRNALTRFASDTKEKAILDGLEYLERQAGESQSGTPSPPVPGAPRPAIPPLPGRKPPPLPGGMPPPLPKKT